MSTGTVSTRLAGRLHLDVTHVDFLIQEEHGSVVSFLAPVVGTGGLIDIDDINFSSFIPEPLFSSSIHIGDEFSFAIVFVV